MPGTKAKMGHSANHSAQSWGTDGCHSQSKPGKEGSKEAGCQEAGGQRSEGRRAEVRQG